MLYPERSKEKSPRAAITHPVAVNRTESVTWKVTTTKSQLLREFPTWWSFSAGMWYAIYYNKDYKCNHFKTRWLPIQSNLLNQIHCAGSRKGMQCSIFSFGIKKDVRKLLKLNIPSTGPNLHRKHSLTNQEMDIKNSENRWWQLIRKGTMNLSCRFSLSWKEPSNQHRKWCESFYSNVHWNVDPFQACQSKCHISIVKKWNWQKLFSCHQIYCFGFCISHLSTSLYKQRGRQLLKQSKYQLISHNKQTLATKYKYKMNIDFHFLAVNSIPVK